MLLSLLGGACVVDAGQAQVIVPDFSQYDVQFGVGKRKGYTQTSAAQGTFSDYTFEAFVDIKSGSTVTLGSAILKGPLLGGTGGTQTLTTTSVGAEFTSREFTGDPTTAKGNLNSNFEDSRGSTGNKTYDLTFAMTDGGATSTPTVKFLLTGDVYPQDVPTFTLDNGAWNSGIYQLDPGQTTNFGWSFANFDANTDVVIFHVREKNGNTVIERRFQGSDPHGFSLTANTFTPGVEYIGELTFARLVSTDTTVPGAVGVAFYALETTLSFQAVPEPSTYILLGLGLGSVLLLMRRQRRT